MRFVVQDIEVVADNDIRIIAESTTSELALDHHDTPSRTQIWLGKHGFALVWPETGEEDGSRVGDL
jgi:hypothetical protein